MPVNLFEALTNIIKHDAVRMRALHLVNSLNLPDCWIGAGFVRDAVWDKLHDYPCSPPSGDVDVIWFDPQQAAIDRKIESALIKLDSDFRWSVKNQARMHLNNNDRPYHSVSHAMRYWPETATAVAVRVTDRGDLEVNAPLGLDDLFGLRLCSTPSFQTQKRDIFLNRIATKQWLTRYPKLQVEIQSRTGTR